VADHQHIFTLPVRRTPAITPSSREETLSTLTLPALIVPRHSTHINTSTMDHLLLTPKPTHSSRDAPVCPPAPRPGLDFLLPGPSSEPTEAPQDGFFLVAPSSMSSDASCHLPAKRKRRDDDDSSCGDLPVIGLCPRPRSRSRHDLRDGVSDMIYETAYCRSLISGSPLILPDSTPARSVERTPAAKLARLASFGCASIRRCPSFLRAA